MAAKLMTEEHKMMLRRHMFTLTHYMIPDGVLSYLNQRSFTNADVQYVRAVVIFTERSERILERLMLKDDQAYSDFLEALKATSQIPLVTLFQPAPPAPPSTPGTSSTTTVPDEPTLKENIKKNYASIIQEVEPTGYILDKMKEGNILSSERVDELRIMPLMRDRCRVILDKIIATSHPAACQLLIEAIQRDYPDLAARLKSSA